MSAIFAIGKSLDTGLPVHVSKAKSGSQSNCVCYKCNKRLVAVKGQRDWYFRHSRQYGKYTNCEGSPEIALHEYAKLILFTNHKLNTTKGPIKYNHTQLETCIGSFSSDVTATSSGKDIHFEIVVSRDLCPEKQQFYIKNEINCIKIDLTSVSLFQVSPEGITHAVLTAKGNKTFVYWNTKMKWDLLKCKWKKIWRP
jgi:hypothetical protein